MVLPWVHFCVDTQRIIAGLQDDAGDVEPGDEVVCPGSRLKSVGALS